MKILLIGGKHRHKYAIANRLVAYAELVSGVQHPFTIISVQDEPTPPNAIVILKSEYINMDVIYTRNNPYDLIVRLPTDSHELDKQMELENSVSSKFKPIKEFARALIDRLMERTERPPLRDVNEWEDMTPKGILNRAKELDKQRKAPPSWLFSEIEEAKKERIATYIPSENGQKRN